jgi:hypothetical protein
LHDLATRREGGGCLIEKHKGEGYPLTNSQKLDSPYDLSLGDRQFTAVLHTLGTLDHEDHTVGFNLLSASRAQ